MNTLRILSIILAVEFGQPVVKLTFVTPVAGRAFVDGKCIGEANFHSGLVNAPCIAGTNTITLKRPSCDSGALFQIHVQE